MLNDTADTFIFVSAIFTFIAKQAVHKNVVYFLGVKAADLVEGVLGGGGAQGGGVAAGLTGAGAVDGKAGATSVWLELVDSFMGMIFPEKGKIISMGLSSPEVEGEAAASLDWNLVWCSAALARSFASLAGLF